MHRNKSSRVRLILLFSLLYVGKNMNVLSPKYAPHDVITQFKIKSMLTSISLELSIHLINSLWMLGEANETENAREGGRSKTHFHSIRELHSYHLT